MELAAAGEDMKKLREIARTHIEKAAAGDMQAIKDSSQPAQIPSESRRGLCPTARRIRVGSPSSLFVRGTLNSAPADRQL